MSEIILSKLNIVFECVVKVHGLRLMASDWCGAVCVHSLLPRNTEVPVPSNNHKLVVWKCSMKPREKLASILRRQPGIHMRRGSAQSPTRTIEVYSNGSPRFHNLLLHMVEVLHDGLVHQDGYPTNTWFRSRGKNA